MRDKGATAYQPVIAIFGMAFLMGIAVSWFAFDTVEAFIAIAMCLDIRGERAVGALFPDHVGADGQSDKSREIDGAPPDCHANYAKDR